MKIPLIICHNHITTTGLGTLILQHILEIFYFGSKP